MFHICRVSMRYIKKPMLQLVSIGSEKGRAGLPDADLSFSAGGFDSRSLHKPQVFTWGFLFYMDMF